MSLKQTILTIALTTPLMLIGHWASADDPHDLDQSHRQHGAHVHGVAALNLALEGRTVQIELDSPAANIVGFEHAPSSAEDRAVLAQAVATLNQGDRLFRFNDTAGCRMATATVTSALLDEEHQEHAGPAVAKAEAHKHAETGGHDHEVHEGDDVHAGETHADIEAAYQFACNRPDKLTALTVELFAAFAGMETIRVQYVIESTQGSAELTLKDHVVTF